MSLHRVLLSLVLALVLAVLAGCVAYVPAPAASPQPRFEQSWAAALGAMGDQGVTITAQDRAAGAIRGQRAGATVTALVQTLAGGQVQVSFESTGRPDPDPDLVRRLRESFVRRMGP